VRDIVAKIEQYDKEYDAQKIQDRKDAIAAKKEADKRVKKLAAVEAAK
jgi:hypothetical protein